MATKYELLAALIDSQAHEFGDDLGWHHTLVGVLRDLHDWENERGADELVDAIYSRIADSVAVKSFDPPASDELEPGQINPETGLYRVE